MELPFQPLSGLIPVANARVESSDGLVLAGDLVYFHFGRFAWNLREPQINPKNCEHQRRVEKRLVGVDLQAKPRSWMDKAYLLGISPFAHNYYHFMTEIVPACLAKPELPLLVNSDFPVAYQDFLREFGINTEVLKEDRVGMAELWLPSCCEHTSASLAWLREQIFKCDALLSLANQSNTSLSRGYISRAKARKRHLQNEAQLLPILARYGIEVLHFESLAIVQQIDLARRLDWWLAPHGAGLANMIFMPKHAKGCEIRPTESSGQYCYEKLARALGLDYHWLLGERSCNFELNPEILEKLLESWADNTANKSTN